jgi:hypothetical protein
MGAHSNYCIELPAGAASASGAHAAPGTAPAAAHACVMRTARASSAGSRSRSDIAMNTVFLLISATLVLAFFLIGCDCGDRLCPMNRVYGIWLRVLDSETGLDAACGATIRIKDGAYIDTLRAEDCDLPDSLRTAYLVAAEERSGTYEIFVEKAGYRPWHMTNVVVEKKRCDCHVRTKKIEARLQPLPASQIRYQ